MHLVRMAEFSLEWILWFSNQREKKEDLRTFLLLCLMARDLFPTTKAQNLLAYVDIV